MGCLVTTSPIKNLKYISHLYRHNKKRLELSQTYGNLKEYPHHDNKRRMPWWTDRVFCMIGPGNGKLRILRNLNAPTPVSTYECLLKIVGSDHRPVIAYSVIDTGTTASLDFVLRRRRLKKLRQIHRLYNEILD